jgi:hypothetical protein
MAKRPFFPCNLTIDSMQSPSFICSSDHDKHSLSICSAESVEHPSCMHPTHQQTHIHTMSNIPKRHPTILRNCPHHQKYKREKNDRQKLNHKNESSYYN